MNAGDKVFWIDEVETDNPLRGCDVQVVRKLFFVVSGTVISDEAAGASDRSRSKFGVYVNVNSGSDAPGNVLLIDKSRLFSTREEAGKECKCVYDAHVAHVRLQMQQSMMRQLSFESAVAKYLEQLERFNEEQRSET